MISVGWLGFVFWLLRVWFVLDCFVVFVWFGGDCSLIVLVWINLMLVGLWLLCGWLVLRGLGGLFARVLIVLDFGVG